MVVAALVNLQGLNQVMFFLILGPNFYFSGSINRLKNLANTFFYSYDLDACDIQEKYPEGFTITLHITVHSDTAQSQPQLWRGFSTQGMKPKILFSSPEEETETRRKFGKYLSYYNVGCPNIFFFRFWTTFMPHKPGEGL